MSNIGAKASQIGHDAATGADIELSFSSSWPLLKIEKQGKFTINNIASDQVIYTHNLGYSPLFWIICTDGNKSEFVSFFANNMDIDVIGSQFGVNSAELKYFTDGGTGTVNGYYYIFRLNLEENFTSPVLSQAATTADIDKNWGIKISNNSKDASQATELRDYSEHSSSLSPLIHIVKNAPAENLGAPGYAVTATHSLGYQPLYFSFILNTGYYRPFFYNAADQVIDVDSTIVRMRATYSGWTGTVVVFKDKLLPTLSETVNT